MYLKYHVTEYPPAKLSDIWEYQPSDTPQFSNLMSPMGSQFSNLTSTTSSWFFLKLPSWKTVRILEQLMFADKYTYIFLHQIEAIVNIDIFIYIYICAVDILITISKFFTKFLNIKYSHNDEYITEWNITCLKFTKLQI